MAIELTSQETPVISKTRELCQTIIEQPHFEKMLADIETFMGDPEAQALYDAVSSKQQTLMDKQGRGESLSEDEINEFEQAREALLGHAVASAFIDARQQMYDVQDSIGKFVSKTFELGRVPMAEELVEKSGGGCCGGGGGGGCGCH